MADQELVGQDDAVNSPEPSNLSNRDSDIFRYAPLPSPNYIRLLEILPCKDDEIRCTITNVNLLENPEYKALSYTWCNPITMYECEDNKTFEDMKHRLEDTESSEERRVYLDFDVYEYYATHPYRPFEKLDLAVEKIHQVRCNDQIVFVTQNLLNALKFLRRINMGDVQVPEAQLAAHFGDTTIGKIWIDAICINQDDPLEVNSQVSIMHQIFGNAQCVIGWMGPEDGSSRLGMHTLESMIQQIVDPKREWKVARDNLCSFDGMNYQKLLSVFYLLQRLWFRRIWVVQEAVLAKKLTLVCGGVMMHWEALAVVVQYMVKYNLHEELTNLALTAMDGESNMKVLRKVVAGCNVVGFPPRDKSIPRTRMIVDSKSCYEFIKGVLFIKYRLGIPISIFQSSDQEIEKNATHLKSSRKTKKLSRALSCRNPESDSIPLEHLLQIFRCCEASDPRDKIFALLSILARSEGRQAGPILEVDYTKSAQELYIAATNYIIERSGNLDILTHVQDPTLTRVSSLPSWVPDFSAPLQTSPIQKIGESAFTASGATPDYNLVAITLESKLEIEAVFIDHVHQVAESTGCYFVRTAKLVSELPQWYLSKHENFCTVPKATREKSHIDTSLPLHSNCFESTLRCEQYLSRVEAYWRTMIFDTLNGRHPAPISAGFAFADWLCQKLYVYRIFTADSNESSNTQDVRATLEEKLACWKELDRKECGKFYSLRELQNSQAKSSLRKTQKSKLNVNTTNSRIRFLPDRTRLNSCFTREYKVSDVSKSGDIQSPDSKTSVIEKFEPFDNDLLIAFKARIDEVKSQRRMFRTSGDYLGMGPISTQEQDELWIIRGARVPFILRKVEESSYRVIGECYVHGLMHGKVMERKLDQVRKITLI